MSEFGHVAVPILAYWLIEYTSFITTGTTVTRRCIDYAKGFYNTIKGYNLG